VLTPGCLPACPCVPPTEPGVEYTVNVTCLPLAGTAFPVSGFSVTLEATQDTPGLPAGSCTSTATEDVVVTVTPRPTLAVTKESTTELCELATGGLQQIATFQVVTSLDDSDISLELEGEPAGAACTATPAVPGTFTGEAGFGPGQHWRTVSFVWQGGPGFQLGLCTSPAFSRIGVSCHNIRFAVRRRQCCFLVAA
jgi:hypothetical protein